MVVVHFYSVTTNADGSEVKTLVTSVVAQEPVAQVIEIGKLVTHVENGQASITETKPRLERPSQETYLTPTAHKKEPASIVEKNQKLGISSKTTPATVPAEEKQALPQGPAPAVKENKLPETGNQDSEWLIATGLMAALTAYGLSKKED